jgi:hypothetical protein
LVKPDYAVGYEVVVLLLAGLVLAFALPLVTPRERWCQSVVVSACRAQSVAVPGRGPGVAAGVGPGHGA